MEKVIFSKQCDHDLDLSPFWLHWYRHIFKADRIIITPVKTPKSSISKTVSFYEKEGLEVYPIEIDHWNDDLVWTTQLNLLKSLIAENLSKSIVISADTDQYFSPIQAEPNGSDVVFRRIFLHTEGTLSPHDENIQVSARSSQDYVAGFWGTLDNDRVGATGHFAGVNIRGKVPIEFHIGFRGFDQFHEKIKGLDVEKDTSMGALHWKSWVRILSTGGEAELRKEYLSQFSNTVNDSETNSLTNCFKELLKNPNTEALIDAPFGTPVGYNPFEIKGSIETSNRYIRYPLGEAYLFSEIFAKNQYHIPEDINVNTVIDVGAHIGLFSTYIAIQHPGSQIIAYEPNPDTFEMLSSNLSDLKNTKLENAAWSNESGERELYRHPFISAEDSLIPVDDWKPHPTKIKSISAIEAIRSLELDQIDVLKLSANGMENEILASISEYLPKISVLFLQAEDKGNLEAIVTALSPIFSVERVSIFQTKFLACLRLRG